MRFKKSPQLPGAGRTRVGHHHGSHTPTSPGAILLSKMAYEPKHIGRQCINSANPSSTTEVMLIIGNDYLKQNGMTITQKKLRKNRQNLMILPKEEQFIRNTRNSIKTLLPFMILMPILMNYQKIYLFDPFMKVARTKNNGTKIMLKR